MSSVYELFSSSAKAHPGNDFLYIPKAAAASYRDSALTLSYQQVADTVETLRSDYQARGYNSGHRVALILQNRAEFFAHWFALNSLGCCVVPVNDEMPADEQAYIINHSEASLVIYLQDLAGKIKQLQPLLSAAPPCLAIEQFDTLPQALGESSNTAANNSAVDEQSCALLYTSGSTGKPKGCILSNEYFVQSGKRYVEMGSLCAMEQGQERLITPLPLVHMNAMACSTMAMIHNAGCIVQLDRFHPRSWWQSVRESRATIVHYLGVMPAMLINIAENGDNGDDNNFSGQVKFAFGAGVNPKHHAVFEQRFGFPLIEAWAMTETGNRGAVIANHEPRHVGECCFGRPPEHLEIRMVDETGNDVPAGEPGELLLRNRGDKPRQGFFSGYLKNPEATAEAWQDGWFHTGDVVRQDPDGGMYFVDRRKNVIRRSGENISALEVEACLSTDDKVTMAIVCPVPDEIRGDEVMACIIASEHCERDIASAEAIVQRSLESLAYYKVPGYIRFFDALPLTVSEKPKRADIKALAVAALDAGEVFDLRHLKKRQRGAAQ